MQVLFYLLEEAQLFQLNQVRCRKWASEPLNLEWVDSLWLQQQAEILKPRREIIRSIRRYHLFKKKNFGRGTKIDLTLFVSVREPTLTSFLLMGKTGQRQLHPVAQVTTAKQETFQTINLKPLRITVSSHSYRRSSIDNRASVSPKEWFSITLTSITYSGKLSIRRL